MKKKPPGNVGIYKAEDEDKHESESARHKLWSSGDGRTFFPISDPYKELPPDVYDPRVTDGGQPFFYRINFSTEELVQFEDSKIDQVVKEISDFWTLRPKFDEFGFPYKRGILLWGPPGGGKSSAIKLIIEQVIKMGGVGVRFESPPVFIRCMRALRMIQKETPIVTVMEDLDAIMEHFPESQILNLLDGIEGFENMVYLATTNYPEDLDSRIRNRPSRFDRRFHIDFPNDNARQRYIEFLQSKVENYKLSNIQHWIDDTKNFTFSHIKELFISVVLYQRDYKEALAELIEMKRKISSEEDETHGIGFQ